MLGGQIGDCCYQINKFQLRTFHLTLSFLKILKAGHSIVVRFFSSLLKQKLLSLLQVIVIKVPTLHQTPSCQYKNMKYRVLYTNGTREK